MSDRVEGKILALLQDPALSPFGNPIPGLDELGVGEAAEGFRDGVVSLADVLGSGAVTVRRIGEPVQAEAETLAVLAGARIVPGATVVATAEGDRVVVTETIAGASVSLPPEIAAHVFVQAP